MSDYRKIMRAVSEHCADQGRTLVDEYNLIKEKKSKLSAQQRACLCYAVESEILKAQEAHKEEN